MKSHKWLVGISIATLPLAILLIALFAWQLRAQYERQLVRQVWPAGLATPTIAQASDNDDNGPTTLLLGDSRISQWLVGRPAKGRIVNAGINGATTAVIADTARNFIEQFHPDVIVIEAGINDLKLLGIRPELSSAVVDEAADNLSRLVDLGRGFRCKVVLLAVWPASKPGLLRRAVWNTTAISAAVTALNLRLQSLAQSKSEVFFYDLLAVPEVKPAYIDTLHLRPETYERLTPILDRKLEEVRSTQTPTR